MENEMIQEAEHACQCKGKGECVGKCVYKGVKLLLKAATVCALFHVAKEVHKVHKAIEHKKHVL